MEHSEKDQSAEKETRKVQPEKQSEDKPVQEGKPNSIHKADNDDPAVYPHKDEDGKQFDIQSEFIDRNSNSKDKS
jgi:hypothetical protein